MATPSTEDTTKSRKERMKEIIQYFEGQSTHLKTQEHLCEAVAFLNEIWDVVEEQGKRISELEAPSGKSKSKLPGGMKSVKLTPPGTLG